MRGRERERWKGIKMFHDRVRLRERRDMSNEGGRGRR